MNDNLFNSYGGFMPLELNEGKERFDDYEGRLSFNSFKAAICYLINSRGIKDIYLPYYYCPSTIEAIKKTNCNVFFYHINNDLMPILGRVCEKSAVLLVNYYGICGEAIKNEKLFGVTRIFDFAHSFFEKPVMEDNVYNIYAPKKFFGVTDGGYLLSTDINPSKEKVEVSFGADLIHYLAVAAEQGTNVCYDEKKKVDKVIENDHAGMSILAHKIMRNVNYQRVYERRKENFKILNDSLGMINEIRITNSPAGYLYPLLIRNGRAIKQELISRNIYVPTLWNGENLRDYGNEFERHISQDGIFLPVDQRYDTDDMKYLIGVLEELVHGNT
jgi:hypothetical protein